jgi:hypothetical protein
MKRLAILTALVLAVTPLGAEIFEGKIVYELQTPRREAQPFKMYLAHYKSRMEMEAAGHKSVMILDAKTRTMSILMPERKTYMVETLKSGASDTTAAHGTLRKTGNHQIVAGYPTEEWIYETEKSKTSLWLTDRLGRGLFAQDMGSRGPEIPLELKDKDVLALKIVGSNGFRLEAKKVEPGPMDQDLFKIPDGYSQAEEAQRNETASGNSSGASSGSSAGIMNSIPADSAQKVEQAIDNLSPDQKAQMQKALQGQGLP